MNASRTSPKRLRARERAGGLIGDPLTRTALPLILNTGLNGVLGLGYWVVAARLYDQAALGTNMAVIAAMTTLSGVTQLNLGPGLQVFIPRAGRHARRVVLSAYLAVTVFAVAVLAGFVTLVLPRLPQLSAVLDSTSRVLFFALGVLTFNIFALQDAALVGLRRGKFVPIENTTFGILKVALLFPLFLVLPAFGVFASWVLPILVIIPAVSWLIFGRRRSLPADPAVRPAPESVSKLGLDYVGYLFQVCSTLLLPVVALELLDPLSAALFAVAWQTSSTLDLLATNVGVALTVETSYGQDPARLRRTVFRRAMPLVGLVTVLGLLAAPLVLQLYGSSYSNQAVHTLQILLLASVPRSLITFAVAEARAHRNVWFIVWLRAQNCVLVLGLAYLLAPGMGVEGIALAWLVAQVAGGAVVLRHMLRRRPAGAGTVMEPAAAGESAERSSL